MTSAEGEQAPRGDAKAPWERPTLTLIGNVKDLIRASGKGSEMPEMDPTGRKDRLSG